MCHYQWPGFDCLHTQLSNKVSSYLNQCFSAKSYGFFYALEYAFAIQGFRLISKFKVSNIITTSKSWHVTPLNSSTQSPIFLPFRYAANSKTITLSSLTDSTACYRSPVKGCLLVIAFSHWHSVCCLYECVWVCGLCSALLCVCSSQFIFPVLEADRWCV